MCAFVTFKAIVRHNQRTTGTVDHRYNGTGNECPTPGGGGGGDGIGDNMDCLMHVLAHLSIRERVKCRLVCHRWRAAVDKLSAGVRRLHMYYKTTGSGDKYSHDWPPESVDTIVLTGGQRMPFQRFHQLMVNFPALHSLQVRNATAGDAHRLRDCEVILLSLPELIYLDVSDNELITGASFRLLGKACETLCAGSVNADVNISPILSALSESSNTTLRHLELKGCVDQPVWPLGRWRHSLRRLSIRFYCPQDQTLDTMSSISALANLEDLALHQERCYDEPSAIDGHSLRTIAAQCLGLRRLAITGEYGWRLRLDDRAVQYFVHKCQQLDSFVLTAIPVVCIE
ncbi:unnamed protein product [Medioppia subpectinata]|uniref:F-box domain-containing protein n=1 Tax=Medioppia subpectinata TaxID=1979941 RepID=A0A7R9KPB6_9ACAR|nr:unnamed protein product [Medioppia subpectinata]CAG2107282.1 unnamed protein product [Medioppia subpectinata]